MTFWQFLKSRFCKMMSSIRAEYVFGNVEDENADDSVYIINDVRYVVSTQYSATENITLKDRIKKYIGSDFAHLTTANDINTINTECVCLTAGKED